MTENSITIKKSIYKSLYEENQQLKVALYRSEQLFQLLIDNIPHSVFWKDRNSVYLGCNRNFAEDAGIGEPENIVGKSDYDLPWMQEETEFFRECDQRVMDNAVPEVNIIETQVQADGKLFWLNTNKIPLRDGEGNVVGILGTYENITERKQTEENLKQLNETLEARVERRTAQLRETETRLSRLADNVPGMIYQFRLKPDGTISFPYVSSGCRDIWEVEPQLPQKNADLLFRMIHPNDVHAVKQAIATSAQTLQNWESEWRIITPSGKHKWLKGISKPQLQPDSSIIWDGCIVDTTQRKKAEEALQQLNEELEARVEQRTEELKANQHFIQSVTESSPNVLYIYDIEEKRNIYVNQEIAIILGYSEKDMKNWGDTILSQIIHPEDLEKLISQHQNILNASDGDILEIEYRVKHSDNEYRWFYDRQTIFSRQKDGNVKQYLGVTTDITKRKLAEIHAQQKAVELEKTLQQLQKTQAQLILNEKMSGLGQMVAGVAHEINNPANFIHANLSFVDDYTQDLFRLIELYQQKYPNPAEIIQEEIENIELDFLKIDLNNIICSMAEGTRRIREIVLSLRNFSRLDEAELKQVNLQEGIDSTLMILQHRLKPKLKSKSNSNSTSNGIKIIKKYGSLPLVECYPSQINQVLLNLFVNAIDALEERIIKNIDSDGFIPEITILTKIISEKTAHIRILDNGDGIPENIISKLFDPFFTTKDVGKGTGLGLSICKELTELNNGKIWVESTLNVGSTFYVQLPKTKPNN